MKKGKLEIRKSEYYELYHMLHRAGAFPQPDDQDHTITVRLYSGPTALAAVKFSFDEQGTLVTVESV
jgi:hypothetical protein